MVVESINWGDAPTWITAVATVLALVAAFFAVRASWHVLSIDRQNQRDAQAAEARRDEAAERAEQADAVAAWTEWAAARNDSGRIHYKGWGAWVVNQSLLPVYDVVVQFHLPDGRFLAKSVLAVLPPQGSEFVRWPTEIKQDEPPVSEIDKREMRVEIHFRDTGGRRWERDRYGILRLIGRDVFVRAGVAEVAVEIDAAGEVEREQ